MFFIINSNTFITGIYIKIMIMTFAICWLSRSPKDFVLASRLFILSGVLVACVALLNKSNGIGLVEGTRVTIGRDIGSVLGDPNDLSLVLFVTDNVLYYQIYRSKQHNE